MSTNEQGEKDFPPNESEIYKELTQHRIDKCVEKAVEAKLLKIRNVATLIVSIVAMGLGLLGYNKLGEWRVATIDLAEKEAEDKVDQLVETAKSEFRNDYDERINSAKEWVLKELEAIERWSQTESERMQRLSGDLHQSLGALEKQVIDQTESIESQLADSADRLKDLTKESESSINRLLENTQDALEEYQSGKEEFTEVTKRVSAEISNSEQLQRELIDLQEQLKRVNEDIEKQQFAARKLVEDSHSQLESLKPTIEDIESLREFVRGETNSKIFRQLHLNYTRIKSFTVRINYVYSPEARDSQYNPPLFNYLWLEGPDASPLQLFREDEKDTSLNGSDSFKILTEYHLFAPFEQRLLGRHISELNGLINARLEFVIPSRYFERFSEQALTDRISNMCTGFNDYLDCFHSIEVDFMINGLPVYRMTIESSDITSTWSEITPENFNYEEDFEMSLSWSTAAQFQDAENYYWERLGKAELFETR
ncbi:MAG: hypothetical protein AB3N14_07505 [Flavobacteriaceae bacterium]